VKGERLTFVGGERVSGWTVGPPPRMQWEHRLKYQETPALAGGELYALLRPGLGAIDAHTGAVRWVAPQVEMREPLWSGDGERVLSLQRIGGALVCYTLSAGAPGEAMAQALTGSPPGDLDTVLASVSAEGWPPALMGGARSTEAAATPPTGSGPGAGVGAVAGMSDRDGAGVVSLAPAV